MTDAHVLLLVTVAFVSLLFVVEQALEWLGRLAEWLDRRGL